MRIFLFIALLTSTCFVQAQNNVVDEIKANIVRPEAEAHLRFLAADEMKGRDAGSPELDIAANYIKTQFRMLNISPAPGTNDYFQAVNLVKHSPPSKGTGIIGKDEYVLKDNLLLLDGGSFKWNGEMVYVGYGSVEDLTAIDVKGKVVLALAGARDADNINKIYAASLEKFARLKRAGATAVVELLVFNQVPWSALINAFHKSKWSIMEGESSTPLIWLKPKNMKELSLKHGQKIKGKFDVEGSGGKVIPGKNVAGLIPGTDPALKDEYIVITAHYDHVGVDKTAEKGDSIFNGARDNATGTVALIQTAKFLSKHPGKRSVILLAVTCEEKGLLGSQWYVRHPLVPLKQTVLNVNCDGVGYNDKTRVTSISLGRTNMDEVLSSAAAEFGFSLGGDPDPREGFYERSDQVSFAREGVPAIKLQPGLEKMDEDIFKYYHKQADEVSSMDLDYITRFYQTFVYAVYLLSNDARKPAWVKGDKFEEAGRKLYE